jgi:serine/threonine protein kinase
VEPFYLGPFALLRRIAVGGMAEVFLARREGPRGFEKLVALKCIHRHLCDDPEFVAMFLDEARIAACLSHPHIAEIHELGEAAGRPFLAEEFVFGKDLRSITRTRGTWPLPEALAIVRDVALALHHAHGAHDPRGRPLHIVHRDVTPKNILVSFEGAVKLIDFGVAKAAQRHTETVGGVRKGKLAYMSPEQVKGEPMDGRSDLFGLGVVLYELCTGRRPFEGESADLAHQIAEEPYRDPATFIADFPHDIAGVLSRALSKSPADRYPDGGAMALSIEACLTSRGTLPGLLTRSALVRELFPADLGSGPLMVGEPVIPSLPASVDRSGTPTGTPSTGATEWRDPSSE